LQQGGVAVFCEAPADADGENARYFSQAGANLPTGKYSIEPFAITFDVAQNISTNHPALAAQGNTIRVRTAPVTFRAVDTATGTQVPLTDLKLLCQATDLLKDLLETKEPIGFNPLTLFLPVGVTYKSSFGDFSIDEKGVVHPSDAAAAFFENGAFVRKFDGKPPAAVDASPIGKGYWLASQNMRRVFKRGEIAPFLILASGELPAAKLPIVAKNSVGEFALGAVAMPAVTGTDSRLFQVDISALAPGKYELTAKIAGAHTFAFEVVDLLPANPLFLFTVNACGESNFTVDTAGLDQLRDTGVRRPMRRRNCAGGFPTRVLYLMIA
jgi:hypothetical protein